jgi:predicted nucleic acid-binding protein
LIFVDTSFWTAFRDRRDDRHGAAKRMLKSVADHELITTNNVRGETWTLLRARAGHVAAVLFLDQLERSQRLSVVRVEEDQEREALAWLRRHDEQPYSFVDATSFAVMRAKHVRSVLTFDHDFVAAGFALVEA